jgi:hypothetical protein
MDRRPLKCVRVIRYARILTTGVVCFTQRLILVLDKKGKVMGLTKPKVQSVKGLDVLSNFKASASDLLRNILRLANNKVFFPMELTVSGKVLTVTPSENQIIESDGAGGTQNAYKTGISPLERRYCSFAQSTINVDTGAVTGSFETGSDLTAPPAMTAGQKVYLACEALSSGKIHILWSEVGTTPDVNTLAWSDDSLKRGFILLTCATGGTGWGAGRFSNGDNANIVCFGSSGGGGGGGDSSFKVRSISGSTLTLSRGQLRLSTGDVYVTGSGTLATTTRVDVAISLVSVQNGTATPTNATTYYLYLDRTALGSAINLTDTGERVIRVSAASEFFLSTSDPTAMDPRRFIYVATIRSANTGTTWSGTGSSFTSAPSKMHLIEDGTNSDEDSTSNYVQNPDFEFDVVGAAPKYVTQIGQSGAGALVTSTAGEVLYGTKSLKLIGGNNAGSLRKWSFALNTLGNFDGNGSSLLRWSFVARTSAVTGVFTAVVYNDTDATEVTYTTLSIANGDRAYQVYFTPVSGKTYSLRFKEASATTGFLCVDAMSLQRAQDFPVFGGLQRFETNYTTAGDNQVISHGLNGEPQFIQLFYFDGTDKVPVDPSSVVISKSSSSLTINTLGFDFTSGKYMQVVALMQAYQDHLVSPTTQFRSSWLTTTSLTTIPHGLGDADSISAYSVVEWNVPGGTRRTVSGLITGFDRNNFYLNWSGFSPSANIQYQIVAGGAALPHALPSHIGGFTKFVGFGPGSFSTLAAAMAAASSGDRILVKANETLSSTVTIAINDIELVWMPGVTLNVASSISKALVISGNRVKIDGMNMAINFSGTLAAAVEVSGDDCHVDRFYIENTTANITALVSLTASAERNYVGGSFKRNSGIVTVVSDAGTDNDYTIRGS